jgi:hypothetical protein
MTEPEGMDRIWFVLRDGQRVLLLEDARQEDMFWYSSRICNEHIEQWERAKLSHTQGDGGE